MSSVLRRTATLAITAGLASSLLAPAVALGGEGAIGTPPPAISQTQAVAGPTTAAAAAKLPALPGTFPTAASAGAWMLNTYFPTLKAAAAKAQPWNGSTSSCNPGSRTAVEQQAAIDVVNLFRTAAGVPALLGPDPATHDEAQAAALMMQAEGALSHFPGKSWSCWTQKGADGAATSNLALGFSTQGQIRAYMDDFGDNNLRVGHRQWMLSPDIARIGVGGTASAGALVVVGAPSTGTTQKRAIAYPPAGYSPSSVMYPRWSLSFHNVNDLDLSNATVSVRRNGALVSTTDHSDLPASTPESTQYAHTGPSDGKFGGLSTLSWDINDVAELVDDVQPGPADVTYRVTISGIKVGGTTTSYSYDVIPTPDRFEDDDSSIFESSILQLADAGITLGCNPPKNSRYCPTNAIKREEMATFFVRALRLKPATRDYFTDDASSPHQDAINRLAEAGITKGCNPADGNTKFCPNGEVTRQEMATFFVNALKLSGTTKDFFDDDATSVHQASINRLAASGITRGCGDPADRTFCPRDKVTREQMAAFFVRAGLA